MASPCNCFIPLLRAFFNDKNESGRRSLLIIQCNNSAENTNLVACAQHICKEIKAYCSNGKDSVLILFLLQLNHTQGGFKALSGSQSLWKCVHIDELRTPTKILPSLIKYTGQSVCHMFEFESRDDAKEKLFEVTELVKGCIQSAVKDLNQSKAMSTEDVTMKINILDHFLSTHEGEVYLLCVFVSLKLFYYSKEV